ncbi:MAG TPA: hypothetical protein VFF75_01185 [Methylophilaceae bacterium]|nr:hypothetical protein [Methylophilaceae bacterium]
MAYQAVRTSSAAYSALDEIELCIAESPAARPLLLTLSMQDYLVEEYDHWKTLVKILQQHLWRDRDVIVHLKDTHEESWGVMQMYRRLQKAGILTMVDAGVRWDLASMNILVDAHIMRFNAAQLPEPVEQLLEFARSLGIQTLAGISNKAQSEWRQDRALIGYRWSKPNLNWFELPHSRKRYFSRSVNVLGLHVSHGTA